MPSYLHETLVELFRRRPALAPELLTDPFKLDLPSWQHAQLGAADLPKLSPVQRFADAVITLTDSQQRPVAAVVVEVQLQPDDGKHYAWPDYLIRLRSRLRCPTMLLVICPNRDTAYWAAKPILIGLPDWMLQPIVLGPD